MMQDNEKNIITHDSCRRVIINAERGELPFYTVIFIAFAAIFTPIIALCISELTDMLALAVVLSVMLAIAPACAAWKLISVIIYARRVRVGELLIVTDTVSRLSKGEHVKNGKGFTDVIYFTEHGRVEAGGVNFDFSSVGDSFYLVLLDGSVRLIYHTKIYECAEVDSKRS